MPFYSVYAYSPRENVGSRGGTHLVTDAPLTVGRLIRVPGDPLCKPSRKFWGLSRVERPATCKRCLEIAKRLAPEIRPTESVP